MTWERDEDEVLGKAFDARLVRRLLPFARPYRKLFLLSLGILFALFACEITGPRFIRLALDGPVRAAFERLSRDGGALEPGELRRLLLYAAGFATIAILTVVFEYLHQMTTARTGQRIIFDIRQTVFRHLQRLPLAFFDRNPAGRLVTRVTNDVEALHELFTTGFLVLFYDLLRILGVLVVLFVLQPRLAVLTVLLLPLLGYAAHVFRTRIRLTYREVRGRISALNAFLGESLQGLTAIRIHGQEARMDARFAERNRALREAHVETVKTFAAFFPVVDFVSYLILGGTLWLGGSRILAGAMTFGEFFQFWFYLHYVFEPILEISEKYNVFQSAMAASERIFRVLDTATGPPVAARPHAPARARGEIEFRGVTFAYEPGRPVLRNVSFRLAPGERLAVVGHTGAGKTTLASLLLRFYDPQEGSILLDGVDLREWEPAALRRAVGVVLQDVFLFAGTVRENLRLGDATIPDERVRESARAAHLEPLLARLSGGLEHVLVERGQNLSAGERQLLALARALAIGAPVLLLDEATSSVDPGTEERIQSALGSLLEGRTAILVAHRLTTLTLADRILVFHKGELREQGTHEELLRARGIYARLWELQFASPTAA